MHLCSNDQITSSSSHEYPEGWLYQLVWLSDSFTLLSSQFPRGHLAQKHVSFWKHISLRVASFSSLSTADMPWLAGFQDQCRKLREGWHPHLTELYDDERVNVMKLKGREKIFWIVMHPFSLWLFFVFSPSTGQAWECLSACPVEERELSHRFCITPVTLTECECVKSCGWPLKDESLKTWVSELQQSCLGLAGTDGS